MMCTVQVPVAQGPPMGLECLPAPPLLPTQHPTRPCTPRPWCISCRVVERLEVTLSALVHHLTPPPFLLVLSIPFPPPHPTPPRALGCLLACVLFLCGHHTCQRRLACPPHVTSLSVILLYLFVQGACRNCRCCRVARLLAGPGGSTLVQTAVMQAQQAAARQAQHRASSILHAPQGTMVGPGPVMGGGGGGGGASLPRPAPSPLMSPIAVGPHHPGASPAIGRITNMSALSGGAGTPVGSPMVRAGCYSVGVLWVPGFCVGRLHMGGGLTGAMVRVVGGCCFDYCSAC